MGTGGHVPPPLKGEGDRGTRKSERTHKNSNPVLDDSITACNAVSVCMMQFSFPALNVSAR